MQGCLSEKIPGHPGLKQCHRVSAFTLAELLIALVILGVIATFTIPKVLQSQQSSKARSVAKEAAATVSQAFQMYTMKNTVSASTKFADLTPYMNFVKADTSSQVDENPGETGPFDCSDPQFSCLVLHNGAVLEYGTETLGGTGITNALWFQVDPDGQFKSNSVADGPSKAVHFRIYMDGKLKTRANMLPNTCTTLACDNPNAAEDPSWFSWN